VADRREELTAAPKPKPNGGKENSDMGSDEKRRRLG